MNWQGWVFMLLAWGVVGSLFFYCFYRILFGDHHLGERPPEGT
jgi:hypothetical protein